MSGWTAILAGGSGAVMVAAAIAKVQRNALPAYFVQFGARPEIAKWLGRLTPVAEAALGMALIFGLFEPRAGIGALALAVCFVAVQMYDARSGRGEGCGCFGILDGATTLRLSTARALTLAAALLAYVVLLAVGADPVGPLLDRGLGVTIGLATVLCFALIAETTSIRQEPIPGVEPERTVLRSKHSLAAESSL